jgi:6-pyruvoyltetrahydropterin/6-carboxytetrahydropterin synthase
VTQEFLDEQGMVCDFADIRQCVDGFIDEFLDHNLLLHKEDSLIPYLIQNNERFLALDEHPTAEVLSKMLYQHLKKAGFTVTDVTLWETASASASYKEN